MSDLFKNRSFVFIWLGQAVAGLGGTFFAFVMSWLLLELTGSMVAMGTAWLLFWLPSLAVQLWSGPWLDRWDRRNVLAFSQFACATMLVAPMILFFSGHLQAWHIYAVTFGNGLMEPLFRPASMAVVASVLPRNRLVKGNSLLEGTQQIMYLVGPPLGGGLIRYLGAGPVLVLMVVLTAVAATLLTMLPSCRSGSTGREPWLTQFRQGLVFFRQNPALFWVGIFLAISNTCASATSPMLLPLITERLAGDAFHYGLFTGAGSLGMIAATVWTGLSREPGDRRLVMMGFQVAGGLILALIGLVTNLWVAIILNSIYGFTMIIFNIHNNTIYQKRVPADLMGRVFAVRILLAQLGMPVGGFVGGVVAEFWGLPLLFIIAGGMVALVALIALVSPVFLNLNDDNMAEASM
ncbi:MAG: MFS transporter [Firmicutes bacterium]|nr:MFS transporter [Bacillota bacterium]